MENLPTPDEVTPDEAKLVLVQAYARFMAADKGEEPEPTEEQYGKADELISALDLKTGEQTKLLKDSLDQWAEIKTKIGKKKALKLGFVLERCARKNRLVIGDFFHGRKEADEVAEIIVNEVQEDEEVRELSEKDPSLLTALGQYQRSILMFVYKKNS